ncbi:hypothetical protein [Pseudoalteromonas sp. G4]|uniref:hypothetical protein n=1 Tax=Pseudoalteromonas sp. G4 TaxID=2992761 RepID=UPI00237EC076|nr:hypothetical protein [Pseudoalteromonas sp. G4]MDE3270477.1 hypothetical protein [Pseudoalteromonas sp. G4]
MSNVMQILKAQDELFNLRLSVILTIFTVAISFFVIGFMYAQVPQLAFLVKLIVAFGIPNAALVFYIYKQLNAVSKK